MTLVLDAGALSAVDRGDRFVAALVKRERLAGRVPVTNGGCVGQAWRHGARQANLARLQNAVDVVAIDDSLGRRAGLLLARAGTNDVIDASVVLIAADGDEILTSDVGDLRVLFEAASMSVDVIRV
jgi:hypothetical protein